ncbi:major facilitator superfamily domain-containing protein 9-like isoform X1 [Diabrotica virgifera virgifera]|uniref:Major facilitator superfamily domain-containing protein 9-like n=2 Tax=Diabrotica virgifera virgifera TaxID=50390 RepID=A0A6P7GPW0_DIAVI|nr:major facilitator superfamily domain-containing protein 9-like isoform X1 [Diabrotica virgifera virgifera]
MESSDDIFKLQLITLFDSLSFGLIYAFLPPYMIVLGGDNVTCGILAVTTLLAQLLSADIVRDLVNFQGRKAALYSILNVAGVCHALLFVTNSIWFTIFARCIFAATNQTSSILKTMILKRTPADDIQFQLMTFHIITSAGYLIGPIVAGCLFDVSFAISCFLAAFLTIVSIGILTFVKDIDDGPVEGSDLAVFQRAAQTVKSSVAEFNNSSYETNWDVMTIKYCFSASTSIFFSKFTQILKHNYESDSVAIGYTTSYMNALMFIGIYCSERLKKKLTNIPPNLLLNYSFAVLLISSLLACYSPAYVLYALLCIPVVLSRTLIFDLWEDILTERNNNDLKKTNESISVGAGLTVPIMFGVVCNQIGHHAVVLFSVLPLVASLVIINRQMSSKVTKTE